MARPARWHDKVIALLRAGNADAAIAQMKVAPSVRDLRSLEAAMGEAKLTGRWKNVDAALADAIQALSAPRLHRSPDMPEAAFTTPEYKLFPSPRNRHREVFLHEVFVPHPYALIDLPSFDLRGKYSLFAAHRLADGKNGQLVTFELEEDAKTFERKFVP